MKSSKVRQVKAWQERLAKGLCQFCGQNPIERSKHDKGPGPTASKSCADCRYKKYHKYKNEAYSSKEKRNAYHQLLKRTVLERYGGRCAICSETRWECLTIDHVNQDGGIERKENPQTSSQWYLRLNKEPLRDDLRVLCMSCNWSIAQWGYSGRDPLRPPPDTYEEYLAKYLEKWGWKKRAPQWWLDKWSVKGKK